MFGFFQKSKMMGFQHPSTILNHKTIGDWEKIAKKIGDPMHCLGIDNYSKKIVVDKEIKGYTRVRFGSTQKGNGRRGVFVGLFGDGLNLTEYEMYSKCIEIYQEWHFDKELPDIEIEE